MLDARREIVQVITTIGKEADGQQLASRAIEKRYAACVQIEGPLSSLYRWKGEVCCDQEWRLVAKTSRIVCGLLVDLFTAEHPYEEPEILVVPVLGGSAGYFEWLLGEVILPRWEFHLFGSPSGPFNSNFESMLARLERLPRMFVEMDGSFVWRPGGNQAVQIDGMIYDAQHSVQYIDLKGEASTGAWETLFRCIAGGADTSQWQVAPYGSPLPTATNGKIPYGHFCRDYLACSE